MARIKKSESQQEQELMQIIADAKNKLSDLQNKRRIKLGELAIKHGLDKFDLSVLDNAFKRLALELKSK